MVCWGVRRKIFIGYGLRAEEKALARIRSGVAAANGVGSPVDGRGGILLWGGGGVGWELRGAFFVERSTHNTQLLMGESELGLIIGDWRGGLGFGGGVGGFDLGDDGFDLCGVVGGLEGAV